MGCCLQVFALCIDLEGVAAMSVLKLFLRNGAGREHALPSSSSARLESEVGKAVCSSLGEMEPSFRLASEQSLPFDVAERRACFLFFPSHYFHSLRL